MNRKFTAILLIVAVALIALWFGVYQPYQQSMLEEQFDESLQNASEVEAQIINITDEINNKESNDINDLMNTVNNEITPKYSDELSKLNQSAQFTSNETEHEYIDLQQKRVELESKQLNSTITTLNALAQYVKGERSAEDYQTTVNNANAEMIVTNNELEQVYKDIETLLKDHPDLSQKLHELNLGKQFYGEIRNNTQNATNSTSNATANNTTANATG